MVAGSSISCYARIEFKGEKMFRPSYLFILVFALLVAGCGATPPTTTPAATPTLPTVVEQWTLKMTHSGGIMGLMRSIEVSSDGIYTVTDERTNKTASGELSKDEIAAMTKMVADAQNITGEKPEMTCADCFIYDIEIQSNGKKIAVQLNDISLPESGMKDLVTSLRELMDSALK